MVRNDWINIDINEKLKSIYKVCFCAVADNNITRFQYHILNKILGTNKYLKQLKIRTNSENLEHLFCECSEAN